MKEEKAMIDVLRKMKTRRDRVVFKHRIMAKTLNFGDRYNVRPLSNIAKEFNISKQAVQKIEVRIREKFELAKKSGTPYIICDGKEVKVDKECLKREDLLNMLRLGDDTRLFQVTRSRDGFDKAIYEGDTIYPGKRYYTLTKIKEESWII